MTAMTYVVSRAGCNGQRDRADRRVLRGEWKMPDKPSKIARRDPRDRRFSFPHQRSRYTAVGRIALAVMLSIATLLIVIVFSGVNMRDADASGDVERTEETR